MALQFFTPVVDLIACATRTANRWTAAAHLLVHPHCARHTVVSRGEFEGRDMRSTGLQTIESREGRVRSRHSGRRGGGSS